MKTTDTIHWTHMEMIESTLEWWGRDGSDAADCRVVESTDGADEPCLIVRHEPTGKTSDEAGNAGRWHLDGTAY